MNNDHWIPIGWTFPNKDAAQDALVALKAAAVQCELRETETVHFCIWVIFEQREMAEKILAEYKQNPIATTFGNRCETCSQQDATVHLTMFDENGNKTLRNLCQDCYNQLGIS